MSFSRISHAGGAVPTTLSADITSGAGSLTLTQSTGWPDGAVGPFYAVLDQGLATEEKVLATTRTALTLIGLTRGVDGTSASAHSSGATAVHCFTATEADEANQAAHETLGLVTTKGDLVAATGSGALGRVPAGANGTVVQYDNTQTAGLKSGLIVAANITPGTITTTEIADGTITSTDIADGTIAAVDIAAGLQFVRVCTSSTRPASPAVGWTIYETDTGKLLQYQGATDTWTPPWNTPWGPVAAPATATTTQGSITTTTDLTSLSVTFTAVANRHYKATFNLLVSNTTGTGAIVILADGANIQKKQWSVTATDLNLALNVDGTWVVDGLPAGATTLKLRMAGTGGNAASSASAPEPALLIVEDAGPNGLPA